eukprot:gene8962-biopygen7629
MKRTDNEACLHMMEQTYKGRGARPESAPARSAKRYPSAVNAAGCLLRPPAAQNEWREGLSPTAGAAAAAAFTVSIYGGCRLSFGCCPRTPNTAGVGISMALEVVGRMERDGRRHTRRGETRLCWSDWPAAAVPACREDRRSHHHLAVAAAKCRGPQKK